MSFASGASSARTPSPTGCDAEASPELVKAIAEFNAGLFFEQHETLEDLWRAEPGPLRALYQGILQVGVGCHHWRSGNRHGARTLLRKGIAHLSPIAPVCRGIDVAALRRDAAGLLARLDRADLPFDPAAAPRIGLRG